MISKAGIAVFLFGNKRDSRGNIVVADGMHEELEIAKSMGLQIIAVGSTGWVAQEIATELSAAINDRSKAFKKAFAIANDPNSDIASTVKAVLAMVTEYTN